MMKPEKNYNEFITSTRRKQSSITGRDIIEETYSDQSRVVFCSSFRRLQQKAQVFSLEPNAAVRTRLTHSLEVADYGKLIAEQVTRELIKLGHLDEKQRIAFINITETSCLLHDIGNLPFGHFGETAIQQWFSENWEKIFEKAQEKSEIINPEIRLVMNDFLEFDGNPQGFRIISFLQGPNHDFNGLGLNLTKSQLFSFLKYVRPPDGKSYTGLKKKPGYFNSEEFIVDDLYKEFDHYSRYPITYLMEASDDIAYCLSDIEDGVEKGILNIRNFKHEFSIKLKEVYTDNKYPFQISDLLSLDDDDFFFMFKITLARKLIVFASQAYINKHPQILKGELDQLFEKGSDARNILDILKHVSRKILFNSREAEDKELAGTAIISGLMEKFKLLLLLSKERFELLLNAEDNPNLISGKKLDVERRLLHQLPKKYIEAYKYSINNKSLEKLNNEEIEFFFRCHLITDFISGMTDSYALILYRLLYGIEIR